MGNLHESLTSTQNLLLRAFPSGIPNVRYFSLLYILSAHMSERCLATVVSSVPPYPDYHAVWNDIGKANSTHKPHNDEVELVVEILKSHGFEEWLAEEHLPEIKR